MSSIPFATFYAAGEMRYVTDREAFSRRQKFAGLSKTNLPFATVLVSILFIAFLHRAARLDSRASEELNRQRRGRPMIAAMFQYAYLARRLIAV